MQKYGGVTLPEAVHDAYRNASPLLARHENRRRRHHKCRYELGWSEVTERGSASVPRCDHTALSKAHCHLDTEKFTTMKSDLAKGHQASQTIQKYIFILTTLIRYLS